MHWLLLAQAAVPVVPVEAPHVATLTTILLNVVYAVGAALGLVVTWFIAKQGKNSVAWDTIGKAWQVCLSTVAHVAQVERPDLDKYLADGKLDAGERAALLEKAWATLKVDMAEKGLGMVTKAVGSVVPEGAQTFMKGLLAQAWDAFIANKLTGAPIPTTPPGATAPSLPPLFVAKHTPEGTVAVKVTQGNPSTPLGGK